MTLQDPSARVPGGGPRAHPVVRAAALMLALASSSCTLGWHHEGGSRTLAPAAGPFDRAGTGDDAGSGESDPSRPVELVLPPDWSWFERDDDLIATRDGVFLQHVLVERVHVDQRDESVVGWFPLAAVSAKGWPLRTVRHLGRRFARGMAPLDAAAVLLESRRREPLVSDLVVSELATRTVAGHPGFRVVFEFRLAPADADDLEIGAYAWSPFSVQGRATPYRSTCFGFVLGSWFYGIECTAARRHHADASAEAFDAIVRSVRLPPR